MREKLTGDIEAVDISLDKPFLHDIRNHLRRPNGHRAKPTQAYAFTHHPRRPLLASLDDLEVVENALDTRLGQLFVVKVERLVQVVL